MVVDRSLPQLLRDALSWLAAALVAGAVAPLELWIWTALSSRYGTLLALTVSGAGLTLLALLAAAAFGRVSLPGRRALLTAGYFVKMVPYWVFELRHGFRVGRGAQNTRYPSQKDFYREDRNREKSDQMDFGVHWSDGTNWGHRVTWIKATGELIIVRGARSGDGAVELVTRIPTEWEVKRRLKHWAYAGTGRGSLTWLRRRARGWNVPLKPRSRLSLHQDEQPLKPWPSPTPPSLGQTTGAYLGSQRDDNHTIVDVSTPGDRRPLYHYVDSSPTGFAWGYSGSGPTDLARSMLADRLGYVPQSAVYITFRDEIIASLPDEFILTFEEVDRWIDEHRQLFAKNPRAEPFDPYAAGGAD